MILFTDNRNWIMPNTIIVGNESHAMCEDYVLGALHVRVGLKSLFKDNGTEQWRIGGINERNREHLRHDTDILTEPDTGRVFPEDPESGVTRRVQTTRYGQSEFAMSYSNYRRNLLIACGAYHAYGQIREENDQMGPGEARKALAQRGIWVSTDDCTLLSWLRYNEARMAVAELTAEDIEKIENLREPQRRILEICADLAEKDWRSNPTSDTVSWIARRSSGWSTSVVAKMQEIGLAGHDGLIRGTGNGWIEITPKGILAVKHLRARDAELGLEGLAPPQRVSRRRLW
jgi:hypothetical protein